MSWLRWFKSVPCPAILDLSTELQQAIFIHNNAASSSSSSNKEAAAGAFITDAALRQHTDQTRDEFLSRIGCRLILLPSGASLLQGNSSPLTEPPASIVYGKLLYGGVTRSRLLGGGGARTSKPDDDNKRQGQQQKQQQRRVVGARTEVKPTAGDNVPVWMMYGGPDRVYEAVDMGAAAVLEIILLPRGQSLKHSVHTGRTMVVAGMPSWSPQIMFGFFSDTTKSNGSSADGEQLVVLGGANGNGGADMRGYSPALLAGRDRNEAFRADFRSAVGGLQPQIDAIVRRVLDGRVIRPADDDDDGNARTTTTTTKSAEASTALEAEELELLGLSPVRGLLLYGPPGCGKTALAREISRALRARTPKIVSAPELLDRWVGGSEKLVRQLFADAEAELAACNGDATKSALHVVVVDEIDAVFRKRSAAEDSGEATRSSVVNQILSKLDGINSIPNLLLIGMTNRRELLDEALLRPGRLEVQVEIPLPNKEGRREIMLIHFDALRKRGRLSQPLCCAIDGVSIYDSWDEEKDGSLSKNGDASDDAVTTDDLPVSGRKRRAITRAISRIMPSAFGGISVFDLASDAVTGGFSGADIAGLVRCSGSLALSRSRKDGNGVEGLLITLEDVKQALLEVKR